MGGGRRGPKCTNSCILLSCIRTPAPLSGPLRAGPSGRCCSAAAPPASQQGATFLAERCALVRGRWARRSWRARNCSEPLCTALVHDACAGGGTRVVWRAVSWGRRCGRETLTKRLKCRKCPP